MGAVPTARRRGNSAPSVPESSSASEERAERIRFSLPLLLLAGASLVGSYFLYSDALGGHATRVPLWVLALSIGIIASVGGTTSLLVGDFSGDDWRAEAEASEQFVVVERAQWQAIQSALASTSAGAPRLRADALPAPRDELPEWSEPTLPPGTVRASRTADETPAGPPAPMGVTHGIESLATEVERMVADLEAAADVPASSAAPSVDAPPASAPPTVPAPSPEAPVRLPPRRDPGVAPSARAAPPATPSSRARSRPAPTASRGKRTSEAPGVPPESEVVAEHRALLDELERRAGTALPTEATPSPPATPPPVARCVGCDARLPPAERANVCRSCRSPMCGSCRDRSTKEGFPGLCALCSILEESARRGSGGSS